MNIRIRKIRDALMSRCCREPYESTLIEGGKLELRCGKCGKICAVLEEKFTKGSWPDHKD